MFSVTSPLEILTSPVNDSQAKFHYSFQKSPRFKKYTFNCSKSFYQAPKQPTRAAGIGHGNKHDFTYVRQQRENPEPTKYTIETLFEVNKVKNVGKTFGLNRDQSKDKSYINYGGFKNPGPGTYTNRNLQENASKYTMRPKTASDWLPTFLKLRDESFDVPGPGNYESLSQFNSKGKLSVSRFKNSRISSIDTKEKRFSQSRSRSPGPGVYKTIIQINDNSHYILSNVKGEGKRIMGNEKRKTFIDSAYKKSLDVPGPGLYRLQSDFGHYDHLNQNRIKTNSRN